MKERISVVLVLVAGLAAPIRAQSPQATPMPYTAIHQPEFVTASEATFLQDDDIMLGVVSDKVANLAAPRGAKIESLRLVLGVFDGNAQRELTAAELDSVALRESRVALSGESGKELEYEAPNGEYFTVRDLIRAVERAETALRADSEWLGGIDVHHIYFEGLEMTKPGHFQVMWGS